METYQPFREYVLTPHAEATGLKKQRERSGNCSFRRASRLTMLSVLLLGLGKPAMAANYYAGGATESGVTGDYNIGIGQNAGQTVTGDNNTAFGYFAGQIVTGFNNVALGYATGQTVSGFDNSAFGSFAGQRVNGNNNSAFGSFAGQDVTGFDNVAHGIAAGQDVIGDENVAIGSYAGQDVSGNNNVAHGFVAGQTVTGDNNSAIGSFAGQYVSGNNNSAIGSFAGQTVTGSDNVALGTNAGSAITASNSISIGTNAMASADNAIAIGTGATATGSVALGAGASAGSGGTALGDGAMATTAGGVALGKNSVEGSATGVSNATVGGITYGGFAGTAPSSVVSVGGGFAGVRQITNVAAGQITLTSTDAINGSQLFSVADGINTRINQLGNDAATTFGGGAIYDSATGAISAPSYTINGANYSNVGTALAAAGAGWNLSAQGANSTNVGPGESVDLKNTDGNITVSKTGSSNDVTFDLDDTITVDSVTAGDTVVDTSGVMVDNGTGNVATLTTGGLEVNNATNSATYGADGITFGNGSVSLSSTGLNNGGNRISDVAAGVAATDAVNVSQLNAVSFVAGRGWDMTTGATGTGIAIGTTPETITPGELVTYEAGNNLIVTKTGNTANYALNPVMTGITSIDVTGGPSISGTGISMNGDKITGLAAGSGASDAVNISQLAPVVSGLGGGANVDPVTGTVTGPTYYLGSSTGVALTPVTDVGAALTQLNTEIQKPITFGTDSGSLDRNLGQTAGIVGGADTAGFTNISTRVNGSDIEVVMTDKPMFSEATLGTVSINASYSGKITGLGTGYVTFTSTDAINGSQLYGYANSFMSALGGGGASIDPVTGALTGPTYNLAGRSYSNVGDALIALNAGWELTTGATGTGIASGATVEQIQTNERVTYEAGNNLIVTQAGNTVNYALNPVMSGITSIDVTGGPSISSTGINMNGDKITNLAPGEISATSTDAINGSQLYGFNSSFSRMNNRVDRVGAMSAALSGIQAGTFIESCPTEFGVGGGVYNGKYALALGVNHYACKSVLFNAGAAISGGEVMGRAGVTIALETAPNRQPVTESSTEIDALRDVVNMQNAQIQQQNLLMQQQHFQIQQLVNRISALENKKNRK
jgi:hypothetical protein